jgi:hypothetical protein
MNGDDQAILQDSWSFSASASVNLISGQFGSEKLE